MADAQNSPVKAESGSEIEQGQTSYEIETIGPSEKKRKRLQDKVAAPGPDAHQVTMALNAATNKDIVRQVRKRLAVDNGEFAADLCELVRYDLSSVLPDEAVVTELASRVHDRPEVYRSFLYILSKESSDLQFHAIREKMTEVSKFRQSELKSSTKPAVCSSTGRPSRSITTPAAAAAAATATSGCALTARKDSTGDASATPLSAAGPSAATDDDTILPLEAAPAIEQAAAAANKACVPDDLAAGAPSTATDADAS